MFFKSVANKKIKLIPSFIFLNINYAFSKSFENNKLEVLVPGRTDIEVGNVISILYPSAEPPNDDLTTVLDPLLSGLYIISGIHHKINSDRHTMNMEVIKNGLSSVPEKVKMDEEAENVS